jgi:N-methylhydantoinase A
MLMADVVRDYSRTVMLSGRAADSTTLAGLFAPLEDTARQEMTREGLCPDDLVLEYGLDMRYQGQSFELTVDLPGPRGAELPSLAEAFGRVHEDIYGYRHADAGVEVVNIRLRARGRRDPLPGLQPRELQGPDPAPRAWAGSVDAVFAGRRRRAAVLLRRHLEPGNQCAGPAVVAEYTSTTVVPPGWRARVDAQANLVMEPAPS